MILQFSRDDIAFISDQALILKRKRFMEAIRKSFEEQAHHLQKQYHQHFKDSPPAKISRGEHLKSMPYLVLDYPRIFKEDTILAYRILFWWGHFISVTLHFKGKYIEQYRSEIDALLSKDDHFFVSMKGDEWNHDLLSEDYHPNHPLIQEELKRKKSIPFLKISRRLTFEEINTLNDFLYKSEQLMIKETLCKRSI